MFVFTCLEIYFLQAEPSSTSHLSCKIFQRGFSWYLSTDKDPNDGRQNLSYVIQYSVAGFRVCGSGERGPHGCDAKVRHSGECARPMVKPYC